MLNKEKGGGKPPLFFLTTYMISTDYIITRLEDVPDKWVYQYYGKISIPDTIRNSFKVLSIFNSRDTKPSLVFYTKDDEILFNDFSLGKAGGKLTFFILYKKYFQGKEFSTRNLACHELIEEYKAFIKSNGKIDIKPVKVIKSEIKEYRVKKFSMLDLEFWQQFNISQAILERYNIHPLDYVEMQEGDNTYRIRKGMMYGYFKKDGSLAKTYQPNDSNRKFNVYKQYTQGWEQLSWDRTNLVITSSMKDGLSLVSLAYDLDFVAPNSETVMLKEDQMTRLLKGYENVFVLYDNDATGNKSADKYVAKYGIKKIELPLSKDISDSVRDHGVDKVKEILNQYL